MEKHAQDFNRDLRILRKIEFSSNRKVASRVSSGRH